MINIKCAKAYCKDYAKIENYEKAINDASQVWECHHRLEISPMKKYFSKKYLIEQGLYYHQKPEALIFLTKSEHDQLHSKNPETIKKQSEANKGKKPYEMTDETKQKLSKIHKGKSGFWKDKHMSEESKRKNSEAHKGKKMTNENKKNLSQLWKGKHWKLVDGKRVWY